MSKNTDKYLNVDSVSIRYREEGKGDTVVLVHGLAGFLEEWEPAMEKLKGFYRVIALDLPGHGLSGKPDIQYTLDNLTDFLKEFVTAKKLEHFHLVGHSLGGAVCLNFVIKYPQFVNKLIVLNSAFIKIPFSIRFLSPFIFQKANFKIPFSIVRIISRKSFYKKKKITREWLNHAFIYINQPGALRTMLSVIHECTSFHGLKKDLVCRFMKDLSTIKIPVLIAYGDRDRVLPTENSLLLHSLIKTSVLYRMENCGHELYCECCDAFCKIAVQFLGNRPFTCPRTAFSQ